MVEYNRSVVYREDWSFDNEGLMDYIAEDGYIIQNDDINGYEIYDYMELSDYELCGAVDRALYTIDNDLHDLLTSRVNVENRVIASMVEHLQEYWYEGDFRDALKVIERLEDGHYDEEMLSYDAFLKANRMIQEVQQSVICTIDIGRELQEISQVVDIEDEMVEMLEKVMEKLKKAEFHLYFNSGI